MFHVHENHPPSHLKGVERGSRSRINLSRKPMFRFSVTRLGLTIRESWSEATYSRLTFRASSAALLGHCPINRATWTSGYPPSLNNYAQLLTPGGELCTPRSIDCTPLPLRADFTSYTFTCLFRRHRCCDGSRAISIMTSSRRHLTLDVSYTDRWLGEGYDLWSRPPCFCGRKCARQHLRVTERSWESAADALS